MGISEFIKWENTNIKKLDMWDIGAIKAASLLFGLLLVGFWPVLASYEWWVYIVLIVLVSIRPLKRFFS